MITRLIPISRIFLKSSRDRFDAIARPFFTASLNKISIISSDSIGNRFFNTWKRFKCGDSGKDSCHSSMNNKIILFSLFLSCVSVVATMLHGGYTRREAAGLSMTSWNFLPEKYPKNPEEWEFQFAEYKKIPEYTLSDQTMTLEEFKHIYDLEYFHRMLGRATGVIVLATSFLMARSGNCGDKIRAVLYSTMVLGQGLLGWYMVKSGFDPTTMNSKEYPTVSPYRLSAHNVLGTLLFSLMFHRFFSGIGLKFVEVAVNPSLLKISSMLCHFSLLSCLITIGYGGLVSGTHSILIDAEQVASSQDEHDMGVVWALEPKWRNLFENQVTVQLVHKLLGYVTAGMVLATAFGVHSSLLGKFPRLRIVNFFCITAVCSQVFMGIYSIISQSDKVRAAHQLGSLQLMASLLTLAVELSILKRGLSGKSAEKLCKSVMNGSASKGATSSST